MNLTTQRPVVVKQLPEQLKLGQVQVFLHEIAPLLKADRPRIVFDFSEVNQMDSAGLDMLLYCLEQAMKRNGDLKLAAVPPASTIVLELTRVDRLFEVFETVSDAVDSFSGFPVPGRQDPYTWYSGSRKPSAIELRTQGSHPDPPVPTADDLDSKARR